MDNSQQFAALLNEHDITDETGQLSGDDTPAEVSAPQNPTDMEESTESEKTAESDVNGTQPEAEEDETSPVEDENGKKYVPEKRFKEVYAKQKESERRAQALEEQLRSLRPNVVAPTGPAFNPNKTDLLETELLFNQFPQFNPSNEQYDEALDNVAASLYTSGKALTKTDAARQALGLAQKLQSRTASIKEETKTFKKAVSEGNIVKPGQRVESQINPDSAGVEELEQFLKSSGNWGKTP